MNIYKSLFLGLVCSAGMHCTFAQTTVWNPDNQNGTFTNPYHVGRLARSGCDPWVDDKFYLVSTSMHYVRVPYCCIGRFGKLGNGRICFGSL